MALYDKYNIPGSFYIPAVTGVLYPAMIQEFKRRPRHEIGIHGWIHERLTDLEDQAEEERLLNTATEVWTNGMGQKPVRYRATSWAFSKYTLDLTRKPGFPNDISAMAIDAPDEL